MLGGLVLLGAGCSGINATQASRPPSFLLPGLLQADPPPAHPDLVLPTQSNLPPNAAQS